MQADRNPVCVFHRLFGVQAGCPPVDPTRACLAWARGCSMRLHPSWSCSLWQRPPRPPQTEQTQAPYAAPWTQTWEPLPSKLGYRYSLDDGTEPILAFSPYRSVPRSNPTYQKIKSSTPRRFWSELSPLNRGQPFPQKHSGPFGTRAATVRGSMSRLDPSQTNDGFFHRTRPSPAPHPRAQAARGVERATHML